MGTNYFLSSAWAIDLSGCVECLFHGEQYEQRNALMDIAGMTQLQYGDVYNCWSSAKTEAEALANIIQMAANESRKA